MKKGTFSPQYNQTSVLSVQSGLVFIEFVSAR